MAASSTPRAQVQLREQWAELDEQHERESAELRELDRLDRIGGQP